MKLLLLLVSLLLTTGVFAQIKIPLPDSIIHTHCINDTTIEYDILVPSGIDNTMTASFIIFFDPHGRPSYPMNLYRDIASELGLGFIGFCNSKNGDTYNSIADRFAVFWKDISDRFQLKPEQLAFCGFSGGAKVSAALSLQFHPSLLIACGADPGINSSEFIRVGQQSIFFIGTRDFNFNMLFAFRQAYEASPLFHLIINPSKHQWPSADEIKLAFFYFLLKNESISESKRASITDSLKVMLEKRISNPSLEPIAKMDAINDAIYLLGPYYDVSEFVKQATLLNSDSAYIMNVVHFSEILKNSITSQKELINALNTKDTLWWSARLTQMALDTSRTIDIMHSDSQHRLFAFLGILMYSMINQSLAQLDLINSAKFLWIYQKIEPNNADMMLFYARYYALMNDCANCNKMLSKWMTTNPPNPENVLNDTLYNRCRKLLPMFPRFY